MPRSPFRPGQAEPFGERSHRSYFDSAGRSEDAARASHISAARSMVRRAESLSMASALSRACCAFVRYSSALPSRSLDTARSSHRLNVSRVSKMRRWKRNYAGLYPARFRGADGRSPAGAEAGRLRRLRNHGTRKTTLLPPIWHGER